MDPWIQGSPTHPCPGPWRLGRFSVCCCASPAQVVLFKHDGTSEVFELEEVLSHDDHAQLEIYEPEPPSGS
jgi:hypothetical protein